MPNAATQEEQGNNNTKEETRSHCTMVDTSNSLGSAFSAYASAVAITGDIMVKMIVTAY